MGPFEKKVALRNTTPLFSWRPRNNYFVERDASVIILQMLNTTILMVPYSTTATFKYESYNVTPENNTLRRGKQGDSRRY